jgi:hypothetical protein
MRNAIIKPGWAERFPVTLAVFIYSALIVFFHWRVVMGLSSRIIAGGQVGGLFIWEFHWFKVCLSHVPLTNPFFSQFLFYPCGTPILLHSPLILLLALLLQTVTNVYCAYNFLCLAAYLGSGISMFCLAKYVTRNWPASFLAGYVYMFSHYSLTQHMLGHLNQSWLVFVPLVFLGLLMENDFQGRGRSLFLLSVAGVCLSSNYFLFEIVIVALPLFLVGLWSTSDAGRPRNRFLKIWIEGYVVAAVVSLIVYWPTLYYAKSLIGGTEESSLSLLSFVDLPAWHSAGWVQALRQFTSGFVDSRLLSSAHLLSNPALSLRAKPENLMGYFGCTVLFLLGIGMASRAYTKQRAWVILIVTGIILSLGPHLQIAYRETGVPLPYLIFQKIPFLNMYRSPSRMILLTSTGLAVLTALAFQRICGLIKRDAWKYVLLFLLVGAYSWEMGLYAIGKNFTPLDVGPAYQQLAQDNGPGAVLELPVAINSQGEVSINAQLYMLTQPLHGKPLVAARPSRHTWDSLAFCENTDFVYELTHPSSIQALRSDPRLRDRLATLAKEGTSVLAKNHIQYVVFHNEDNFFSDRVKTDYRWFLETVLGPPTIKDENGVELFRVF